MIKQPLTNAYKMTHQKQVKRYLATMLKSGEYVPFPFLVQVSS